MTICDWPIARQLTQLADYGVVDSMDFFWHSCILEKLKNTFLYFFILFFTFFLLFLCKKV